MLPFDRPFTSADEIFTADEISDIMDKVLSFKHLWTEGLDTGNLFLPAALFLGRNLSLKGLMEENFSEYYLKFKDVINSTFQISAQTSTDYNYPGFNIFQGPLKYANHNFHRDRWNGIDGPVWSVNIPICLPESNQGLNYTSHEPVLERDNRYRKMEGIIYHQEKYEVSRMTAWWGEMPHSIGHFTLKENEYRITMQCHVLVKPTGESEIFW